MKSLIALALVASAAASAQAVELFNNGPLIDGFGAPANASNVAADNFTVTGPGWNVQGLQFFGYHPQAANFSFTEVTWSLRSGADINAATVVASGTTAVTNGGQVLAGPNRTIYRLDADIPDITLAPGAYFVTWQLFSTAAQATSATPPVLGSPGTGNSQRCLITVVPAGCTSFFANTQSGQTFDLPFTIQGSVVPEPASWALMLAGGLCVASLARRRRAG